MSKEVSKTVNFLSLGLYSNFLVALSANLMPVLVLFLPLIETAHHGSAFEN